MIPPCYSNDRKIAAKPLCASNEGNGIYWDQKAGKKIQHNVAFPARWLHPTGSSSPSGVRRTFWITLPVFFRMSSSRRSSVMVDTRE